MKKNQSGFTLIEMAVVVLLIALLMSAGLKVLTAQSENAAYSATKKKQDAIKDSLINYLGKYRRLPCPDTKPLQPTPLPPDGVESRNVGNTPADCNGLFGVVPYATLGLSKDVALDGWENYISYVVSPQWTLTLSTTPLVAGLPLTNIATNAFNIGNFGTLTVNDRVPPGSVTPIAIYDPTATPSTGAVVVLISHGKNGFGAFTVKGSRNGLPPNGTDEFVNTTVGTTFFKREYTDLNVPTFGLFDDTVAIIKSDDLINPLTKEGSLNSIMSTLNQTIASINGGIIAYGVANRVGSSPSISYPLQSSIATQADPWGTNIAYQNVQASINASTSAGTAYTLKSYGPDRILGGSDDIIFTVQVTELQGIFAKTGF